MSLCNTNWKNVSLGQTHQPDVDFIVNGRDGQRVFPAHRYLLAIVSPVLKEQFYGENRGNLEQTSGRIKIHLDSSYIAVEAFFKYIFENCFGNLAFNDLFELLRLSERFQMEKMSIDVKEFIVKFIVDNKVETVEEICIIKKVEKDFKDKLIIMKDQLGQMAEENDSLKHTAQQYKNELKEKNEKLEQALIRTSSFEQVEASLKLDFNVLQKDRNILTEANKMFAEENKMLTEEKKKLKDDIESMSIEEENKSKHNMANLQKEQDILVEEKEVLVAEIKALKSQVTDFALEKERMDDFCDSLSLSNDIIMKENVQMKDKVKQNAAMKDKMKQIAEKAKLKGVKKTKKNISGVLEEISKMSIGVAESIHDNTDDGEKTTEVPTLVQKSFAVGDSFIAQWIQDGLWSRGVINSVYPNGKIVVKFINSQKWKELPIDKGVLKTSNNQTQNVGDELINNTQLGFSISKSERMEVKPETNFEVKENHSEWSYTAGSRSLISIPTGQDDQEIEGRANILELKNKSLELENKLLKERVSTTRETFKKALINSNVKHKTNTDEKKLLEEEMEAMKIAYGAQINFLKKEIGSLKGRCSKDESSKNPAEMSLKESEIKLNHSINPAVTSPNQTLNEISPKVNNHRHNVINEETLAPKRQNLELIENVEDKNEQLNMVKDELKKINEELTDVKETLACKKQELEKLKADFDDKNEQYFRFKKVLQSKNEQLEMIKSNVAVLKEVEKNLTLAERNLLGTIKSLNEDKKKLEKENEQLKSSTTLCVSPPAKKLRLSCDVSDEGDKSEDLRMSLDQRKIRRVLANNVESGSPDVNDGTAVHDDKLDNFDTIQIETGSEEADDIEDFEYVDSASGRSANNSPRSAPTHLEKTQSAKSHNRSPATHHTPSLRTQSSRSPERGGRFRARRSTPSPSANNRRSRTRSPQNRGSSRTCKSSPRRQSSSSNKRPHCPERGRSNPRKRAHEVKQETKDFDKIQVTVQRKGIHSPPDKTDSNVKERCSIGSTGQGKTAQQKNAPTNWARIKNRAGRGGFRKKAEKNREKKSHDESEKLITLDGIRYQVKDCDKGKVFQRLGEKTNQRLDQKTNS